MKTLGGYLLLLLLLSNLVSASFISLTTEISTTGITSEYTNLTLKITNNGDEAAKGVQPILEFNNKEFLGETKSTLEPGLANTWHIPIKTDISTPGRYPLILRTNYFDINSYAFSSVSPSYITIGEDTSPKVFGNLNNIEMFSRGTLNLELVNLDNTQKNIKIRLYVPRELTIDKETTDLIMPPRTRQNLNFTLERFSALPGSNYVIVTAIEYEEKNKHYSNNLINSVKITEESKPAIKSPATLIISILIAVLFIITIIFLELRRKSKKPAEEKKYEPLRTKVRSIMSEAKKN